jgi:hypothetical protein
VYGYAALCELRGRISMIRTGLLCIVEIVNAVLTWSHLAIAAPAKWG